MIKIIPENNIKEDFTIEEKSNKTYKLNIEKNVIEGKCEGIEAIKQTIYCILNTERFEYLIYSWDYGIEIKNLIGEQSTYVIPELERVIKEALMQDDRIEDIKEFTFNKTSKNEITVIFKVITSIGDIIIKKEVNINEELRWIL